ncbi:MULTISPECIES: phosphonate C-P lyase system protein PhnL [Metabacillus]|jgi:alpha-D-ribose 1-methylphosphonate 5-triphosphate synthase subunit PhnL|uniref:Phosphonate C-P lyase system protein PhnL n=3 Tax=Metabacillus TaxID=2675233 RepID=A0A179SQW1_9BACI|nr:MULTISPECIES: phosphonate C-P lyase system protein PhnL [Metabacillus]OAS84065.1 phosphonate C-P lyase system protein PhnL [Metabacillus litoralis]QNF28218.1 phosphonate C-P lyase system protein PhnL [Metabacillus sp. KUDC1714]
MAELLSMKELEKTFIMHYLHGEHVVGCKNISFDLNEGEFIGITGKSGAGKSTILKTIYRTYLPTGGKLIFHSDQYGSIDLVTATEREMIALRKKEIGYVSQFLNVMPRVTALEVVMDAILEMGVSAYEAEEKAKNMLAHFRLPESLWDSFPKTFSGGEKLRLNLAQAMVKKPKLLLLDEPTASLDEASKRSVKEMIEQLKQSGTSMIGIFHDLEFMESVVDSHYHLENGVLNKKMVV